jgi:hypothetical protein
LHHAIGFASTIGNQSFFTLEPVRAGIPTADQAGRADVAVDRYDILGHDDRDYLDVWPLIRKSFEQPSQPQDQRRRTINDTPENLVRFINQPLRAMGQEVRPRK